MTTVPSAGTPCRPRGNCPVDIFSTSRDWCSVQGVRVLFGPMLQTTPSKGGGTIPQSGCRAGRECCGKLWAVVLHPSASSLYGRTVPHSQPAIVISGSAVFIFLVKLNPEVVQICLQNLKERDRGNPCFETVYALTGTRDYNFLFCTCTKATEKQHAREVG